MDGALDGTDNSLARARRPLRRIGMGHCGSVWANPDTTSDACDLALKREDGGPGRSIKNEHSIHLHLLRAVQDLSRRGDALGRVVHRWNIPLCRGFLRAHDVDAWAPILPHLPPGYTGCNALISERIPPVRGRDRQLLIDKYCPDPIRASVAADVNNGDCLIRPYLGRRRLRPSRVPRFKAFSLRNLPLHADQMEELGLDLCAYAAVMAEALAFLHWRACIDAQDVEFVLAPPRPAASATFSVGQLGEHSMWILDFDCCRPLTLDEDGVAKAVVAFYRNDPFYPRLGRPGANDAATWNAFRKTYLDTSHELVAEYDEALGARRLPKLFIDMLLEQSHEFRASSEA